MLSNLKLPHWAQLAIALAVIVVTWVMNEQASGALVLPAAVVSVLTVVKTVLGLFSGSASGKAPAASSQRGFARVKLLGALSIVGFVGAAGCGWWQNGGAQTVVTQGAQTLACELAQAESTGSVSLQTLLACVGGVASDLVADLTSILGYYTQPAPGVVDGGASAAMLCGDTAKPPPYPGAPACMSVSQLSMLRDQYEQARVAAGGR